MTTPSAAAQAPPSTLRADWPAQVTAAFDNMRNHDWFAVSRPDRRPDTLALVNGEILTHTTGLTARLRSALPLWRDEIPSRWAINTITYGARFTWTRAPTPAVSRPQPRLPRQQQTILRQHVADLLQKGAIRRARPGEQLINSPMFSVPKKDGSQRPIVDLRGPNASVLAQHFLMPKIKEIAASMPRGAQMITIDAKDAYLSVPLCERDGQRLSFSLDGQAYVPTSLVFGAAPSPRVYQKLMGKLMQFLRARGISCVNYLDDVLCWQMPDEIEDSRDRLLATLLTFGVTINVKKSHLTPTTHLEWLGLEIDTVTRLINISAARASGLRAAIRRLLHRGARAPVRVRDLARLVGELTFAATAAPIARLASWAMVPLMRYGLRVAHQDWTVARATLSREARRVLAYCETQLHRRSPLTTASFDETMPTVWIQSDASEKGWGAVLSFQPSPSAPRLSTAVQGTWHGAATGYHIGVLETLASFYALRAATRTWTLQRRTVLILSDSTTCLGVVRRGGSQTPVLRWIARRMWMLALQHRLVLRTQHVPGVINTVPDHLSRQAHPSATFEVPQDVFNRACALMNVRPQIDLFASRCSTRLPIWVSRFHEPGAFATDAMTLDWNQLPGPIYACPPPRMIPLVLNRVSTMSTPILMCVPFWPTAPFFLRLRALMIGAPLVLDVPLVARDTVTSSEVTMATIPSVAVRQILFCWVCGTRCRAPAMATTV